MVNESNGYKTRKPKRRLVPLQNRQHAILSPTYSGTEMKMGREGREEERMKGEGSEENGNVRWETRRRRQKSRGTGRERGVRKVEGDGGAKGREVRYDCRNEYAFSFGRDAGKGVADVTSP